MPRTPQQNLTVRRTPSPEDLEHPVGRVFAERIAEGLRGDGFPDAAAKCYSDRGWSVDASAGEVRLSMDLVLDREPDEWLLHLQAVNQPALLSRVLGAKPARHSAEMGRLASAVHRVLESLGCTEFRWCLDDNPTTGWTSPNPFRPPEELR
jgi:hypothetical protein